MDVKEEHMEVQEETVYIYTSEGAEMGHATQMNVLLVTMHMVHNKIK